MEIESFKTRIINLDSRKDRWEKIPSEMAKMRISDYERFQAIPGGSWASVSSHAEALKGVEGYLLLCEDDVVFLHQARDIFEKALTQIEGFDMIYLGGNIKAPVFRCTENLFHLKGGTHTTHAIMYSEECRNKILDIYNYQTNKISVYDHWLHCVGQEMFDTYMISPMVAYQSPGLSDCRGDYQDYFIDMRSNELYYMT